MLNDRQKKGNRGWPSSLWRRGSINHYRDVPDSRMVLGKRLVPQGGEGHQSVE